MKYHSPIFSLLPSHFLYWILKTFKCVTTKEAFFRNSSWKWKPKWRLRMRWECVCLVVHVLVVILCRQDREVRTRFLKQITRKWRAGKYCLPVKARICNSRNTSEARLRAWEDLEKKPSATPAGQNKNWELRVLIRILKFYQLYHDVVTKDANGKVSTAYNFLQAVRERRVVSKIVNKWMFNLYL